MPTLRIADLNTHWGVHRAGHDAYDLVDAIARFDADLVCLQEVWGRRDRTPAYVEAAERYGYECAHIEVPRVSNRRAPELVRRVDGDEGSWWGLVVLSRYPVHDVSGYALDHIKLDDAVRRVMRATVDVGGTALDLTVTHLTHRLWGSYSHLRRLRALLPDPAAGPAICTGDMNMWGPVVRSVLRGWRRAVTGRTWPAHRPHSQIDHILVTPSVRVLDQRVGPDVGSDHRPVLATVEF